MSATRFTHPLARAPCGIVRGEKYYDRRDFLWLSEPSTRQRGRSHLLCLVTTDKADPVSAFDFSMTRRDCVDSDVHGS